MHEQTLIERLRIRAKIRRQIPTRKSVQEGQPDRLADLLEEAADALEQSKPSCKECAEWHSTNELNREWKESLKRGREIVDRTLNSDVKS